MTQKGEQNVVSRGWRAKLKALVPSEDSIRSSRLLAPVADRLLNPALWRADVHSVPRGAALGAFIAGILPFGHHLVAILLAPFLRANIIAAVGFTWVVNPLTVVPYFYAAYRIGARLCSVLGIGHQPAGGPNAVPPGHSSLKIWWQWAESRIIPLSIGAVLMAIACGVLAFVLTSLILRLLARLRGAGGASDSETQSPDKNPNTGDAA